MFKRFLLALSALLLSATAWAAPISYQFSGVVSGEIDGQAFIDANFVITALADTDNVGPWCCSNAQNTSLSATVSLSGVGLFAFTEATHVWIAENCCLGFGRNLDNNLLTLFDSDITAVGYGLNTAFGPVTDAGASTQGQFVDVQTSGGLLTFRQVGAVTFEAMMDNRVPEPGSLALVGLAGLALLRVRRRR